METFHRSLKGFKETHKKSGFVRSFVRNKAKTYIYQIALGVNDKRHK